MPRAEELFRTQKMLDVAAMVDRLHSEPGLPHCYRRILARFLEQCQGAADSALDVSEQRALAECWNLLIEEIDERFPLQQPLPRLAKPAVIDSLVSLCYVEESST